MKWLWFTGVWLYPIIAALLSFLLKKMCPERTKKFERISRISSGYVQNVEYIAAVTI